MPRVHGFRAAGTGRPFVRARVYLPRLRAQADINFLVDTGADLTSIHWGDRSKFDTEAARSGSVFGMTTRAAGVGGPPLAYGIEEAEYHFEGEDGPCPPIPARVHVALDAETRGAPSLLGRDLLDVMLCCVSGRALTLEWPVPAGWGG